MGRMSQILRRLFKCEKAMMSAEIAVAVPMLLVLSMSCVEVTGFALFSQKLDKAVTTMGDLSSQARGLTQGDVENLYDAAKYAMQPFDLAQDGSVILSSISPNADGNAFVNWQWKSADAISKYGSAGGLANMPDGLVVRNGESMIVAEVYLDYEPIIMSSLIPAQTFYQASVYRPRFDALTALEP